jgi:hypothetical protein
LDIEAGRQLVTRTLAVVQGHPKLIEFAEAQAADPKSLAEHLDQAEKAWTGDEGQLQTFFREGESAYDVQDFLQALDGWTRGIWSRFNDYYPTLMLSDEDEQLRIPLLMCAGDLLQQCRAIFEEEHNFLMLGKVFDALANLEGHLGYPQQALAFEKTALRYAYLAGGPESCAMSHNNLSIWLERIKAAPGVVLAHTLAAAVLWFQIGSGELVRSLQRLKSILTAQDPNPPLPESFDELAGIVEQVEGVRFRELFERLPQRVKSGDEALTTVLNKVAEYIERAADEHENA